MNALARELDGSPERDDFLCAMAELPGGVTALTAWGRDGQPVGVTVTAVSSLSLDPALVLVCLARTSDTRREMRVGGGFLLHILCDGQQAIAHALSQKGPAKFDGLEWVVGLGGLPELPGSAVTIFCSLDSTFPGGDHMILVGAVREIASGQGRPLVYHRRSMIPSPIFHIEEV